MPKITFLPQNLSAAASAGDTILDAALSSGIELPHECGGNCACTTCHVYIIEGADFLSVMEDVETDRLSAAENWTAASRLGCQAILQNGAITVRIPVENGV